MVPSPNLGVQERSDLPPEQQPPRSACRYCGARPLSTANVAGGRNPLICPTYSASPYVVHDCRWITSLAGGSSCRGNVGWLDMAPSIQLSLRLKRHLKWCATAIRVVITFLSVSARRSVELDDDKVVSEYEEDWPEGGIGSAIRVSCPSYLGPSWQLISEMAGVTMTLFCTHGRVSGPNSLLDNEVIAPCGYSVPCQFWPVVRRHGRGVLWAGAILAWRGVSSARLQAQSSRKVGVRPLLMEPGTRLRHSWAAVTDHDVYAF